VSTPVPALRQLPPLPLPPPENVCLAQPAVLRLANLGLACHSVSSNWRFVLAVNIVLRFGRAVFFFPHGRLACRTSHRALGRLTALWYLRGQASGCRSNLGPYFAPFTPPPSAQTQPTPSINNSVVRAPCPAAAGPINHSHPAKNKHMSRRQHHCHPANRNPGLLAHSCHSCQCIDFCSLINEHSRLHYRANKSAPNHQQSHMATTRPVDYDPVDGDFPQLARLKSITWNSKYSKARRPDRARLMASFCCAVP